MKKGRMDVVGVTSILPLAAGSRRAFDDAF